MLTHRLTTLFATLALLAAASQLAADEVRFADKIAPILNDRCLTCHNRKQAEGGYRVDTFADLLKAGDSEANPISAGNPDQSELWRRISSDDEFERMPAESDPLPAGETDLIRRWIEAGANCDDALRGKPLAAIVPAKVFPSAPKSYQVPIPVTALAFSPDGSRLLVSGYHEVTVWNVNDGSLVERIGNVGRRVQDIDLSPDGRRLAVACGQPGRYGEARVIDLESKSVLGSFARTGNVCFAARFSPTGDRLAIASADAAVRIVSITGGKELHAITSHSDWVTALAWSNDGKRLATASRDKTAKVFDTGSGKSLITFDDHDGEVRGVAFHADGKRVWSIGGDGKLRLWKIADGKQEKDLRPGGTPLGLHSASDNLFVAATDGNVYLLNRDNGDRRREFGAHSDWSISLASHAETKRLAAGSIDGRVLVFDVDSGDQIVAFLASP